MIPVFPMRNLCRLLALLVAVLSAPLALAEPKAAADAGAGDAAAPGSWCAPELESLPGSVCHAAPDAGSDTLVIFLHGVIKPDTHWQWAQQRTIARAARRLGFETLMPRGLRGIGPRGMKDWWTWPTSYRAQKKVEPALLSGWKRAVQLVEKRRGKPFKRTYVFGFSNGAYYASALALRGRMPDVDGYGIFSGGAAPRYLARPARGVRHRPPVFIGYGRGDHSLHRGPRQLAHVLASLRWKHRLVPRHGGHTMTDRELSQAIGYLSPAHK